MLENSVDAWNYHPADAAFSDPTVDSTYSPIITLPTMSPVGTDSLSIPTPKSSDLCPKRSDSTICDPEDLEATCPHSFTSGTISCDLKRGAESPLESDIQNGRALSEAKEQILTKGGFHSLGTDERVLEGKPHPQRESLMRDAKRRKNM